MSQTQVTISQGTNKWEGTLIASNAIVLNSPFGDKELATAGTFVDKNICLNAKLQNGNTIKVAGGNSRSSKHLKIALDNPSQEQLQFNYFVASGLTSIKSGSNNGDIFVAVGNTKIYSYDNTKYLIANGDTYLQSGSYLDGDVTKYYPFISKSSNTYIKSQSSSYPFSAAGDTYIRSPNASYSFIAASNNPACIKSISNSSNSYFIANGSTYIVSKSNSTNKFIHSQSQTPVYFENSGGQAYVTTTQSTAPLLASGRVYIKSDGNVSSNYLDAQATTYIQGTITNCGNLTATINTGENTFNISGGQNYITNSSENSLLISNTPQDEYTYIKNGTGIFSHTEGDFSIWIYNTDENTPMNNTITFGRAGYSNNPMINRVAAKYINQPLISKGTTYIKSGLPDDGTNYQTFYSAGNTYIRSGSVTTEENNTEITTYYPFKLKGRVQIACDIDSNNTPEGYIYGESGNRILLLADDDPNDSNNRTEFYLSCLANSSGEPLSTYNPIRINSSPSATLVHQDNTTLNINTSNGVLNIKTYGTSKVFINGELIIIDGAWKTVNANYSGIYYGKVNVNSGSTEYHNYNSGTLVRFNIGSVTRFVYYNGTTPQQPAYTTAPGTPTYTISSVGQPSGGTGIGAYYDGAGHYSAVYYTNGYINWNAVVGLNY